MKQVYQTVLQLSLSGSLLILALLLLRLCFQRFPKWGNVALWGLATVRLLLPFRIESRFSLIPGKTTPQYDFVDTVPVPDVGEAPTVATGAWDLSNLTWIVWIIGVLFFLTWFAFSYFRLSSRLKTAVRLRDNIYQSEFVATPMVAGFIRPRIYLPFRVDEACLDPILAHEQAHIRRGDPWWKLLAFVCLAVHWFNPLVWVAYFLFGRDVEFACDEAVIEKLDQKGRADYAQALMVYGAKVHGFPVSLMAFSVTETKGRIRAVARYKRPGAWRVLLLGACCLLLTVCFLTDPVTAVNGKDPDDGFTQSWEEKDPITTVPSEGTSGPVEIPTSPMPSEEELLSELVHLKKILARYQEVLAENMQSYQNAFEAGDVNKMFGLKLSIAYHKRMVEEFELRVSILEAKIARM